MSLLATSAACWASLMLSIAACGRPAPAPRAKRPSGLRPVCRGLKLPLPARPLRRRYAAARGQVQAEQRRLAAAWRRARTPAARQRVVRQARAALERGLAERLAPHWCGTPWAFHGTTRTPRQGRIACGYFVTTLLSDVGLRVERAPLARRPAEAIIKSLTTAPHIRRFSNAPIKRFVSAAAAMGAGWYVVGLDYHVGFLRVTPKRVSFVHASFLAPKRVVDEDALTSPALVASRYRVLGRLSADRQLIVRWLTGAKIATR